MAKEYNTVEDAAAAAQKVVRKNPMHSRFELMAFIYQDPKSGKYKYTDPQTQGKSGKVKATVTIPQGSLRGIFHNHPEGRSKSNNKMRKFLSPDDVSAADQTGVQTFIDVDDELLSFDPKTGKRKSIKLAGGRRGEGGVGEPVLAQIPMDELRQKRVALHEKQETQDIRRLVQAKAKVLGAAGGK
jgi:hypothetical protein